MHVPVYNGIYYYVYLWVHTMKVPLWQLERVASGTHYAPELIRLPLDTAKGCQGTIHNMRLQNMIQLSCGPPGAWASSHIALVRETQCFLKVLSNPFCQLGGQPAQNRVASPVNIFQPVWRRTRRMPNGQSQVRGEILVLKLESAGLKKVDIKAHTTSRLYGASLCIIQYAKYNTVHTITYQYIQVQTSMYWYVHKCMSMSQRCVTSLNVCCS